MLVDDRVVKDRLEDYAKNNDINMFMRSIFPEEFKRILLECYRKNDEAFNRLLDNQSFQNSIMKIMAREIYSSLVNEDKK